MIDHHKLGVSDVAKQIRERQLSPETLVCSLLSRIDSLDGTLRAWVTIDREEVLAIARLREQELEAVSSVGIMHGVPVGLGEELKQLLIEGLARWDRKLLFQASGEKRLVFGMSQDAGDLFDCPHLRQRGFFSEVDHPVTGKAQYPGMGPRLSDMEFQVRRAAPLLGQHNAEIYGEELGLSTKEMAKLAASCAI